MPVICAKHHGTNPCHNRFGMREKGKLLCSDATRIDWQVGQVSCRTFSTDIICNGIEYLSRCKRAVIRDVVDIAWGLLVVGSQEEPLYSIGDVAKRQCIVSSSNNHALASFHPLGHATKVQAVTGAKDSARTKDHCLHI